MNDSVFPPAMAATRPDYVFWIVLVTLIAAVSFVSYWLSRRRRLIWKQFARQNGLDYHGRTAPSVSGIVEGRRFSLRLTRESSDRGLFGIQVIEWRLAIRTGIEVAFDVTNEGVFATALREATGEADIIHIDTEAFDQRTTLHTSHPGDVAMFLTAVRQAAILGLIAQCKACDVHVTDSEIRIRERSMPKSVEALNNRLCSMQLAANELEGKDGSYD